MPVDHQKDGSPPPDVPKKNVESDTDILAHRQRIALLFHSCNEGLVAFLRRRLADESEARETAQEAYLQLLQVSPGSVRHLKAYLFRTAANLASKRLRSRVQIQSTAELQVSPQEPRDWIDGERKVLAAEELRRFQGCLQSLPPKCREVFLLHRLEELTMREIASQMGISERMVRKHVAKAEKHFQQQLGLPLVSSPANAPIDD